MAEKTNRSLDKDYLNKRAETLQQFMDQVIESETLRSSLQLLSFLKVADGSTWLKVREQFDKAIVPTSVAVGDTEHQPNIRQEDLRGQARAEAGRLPEHPRHLGVQSVGRYEGVHCPP